MPAAAMAATAGAGSGGGEELGHLGADPLAREPVEAVLRRGAGGEAVGVEAARRVAVPGVEAEEAQDAQIVLGDPRRRVADEAHAARAEVGRPPSGSTTSPSGRA